MAHHPRRKIRLFKSRPWNYNRLNNAKTAGSECTEWSRLFLNAFWNRTEFDTILGTRFALITIGDFNFLNYNDDALNVILTKISFDRSRPSDIFLIPHSNGYSGLINFLLYSAFCSCSSYIIAQMSRIRVQYNRRNFNHFLHG